MRHVYPTALARGIYAKHDKYIIGTFFVPTRLFSQDTTSIRHTKSRFQVILILATYRTSQALEFLRKELSRGLPQLESVCTKATLCMQCSHTLVYTFL